MNRRPHRSKNPTVLLARGIFCFFGVLGAGLYFFSFPIIARNYVRPYDLIDARFCHLTPRPFLCKKCLAREEQFVQILRFEKDGRPVRTYACRPYKRK